MLITVEPASGEAIYAQIVRQIKFAIADQTLRPGQLLPSVRQLSQQVTVNPNTVARAYQQLQADGIIETLRGQGVVVCKGALQACRKQRKQIVAQRIEGVLTEALHGGLSVQEIDQIVQQKLKSLDGNVATIGSSSDAVP
ncbi:GntR family transcriptional regulator [Rosistilla carotiformis]|nr:GntR family transcriptional regulator [Rosistilla carotiformis]